MPIVTVSLIIVNIIVFFYQLSLRSGLEQFIYRYGFVPADLALHIGLFQKVLPLFTSMFLHGSLIHLFGNMLYLWIFADNVEDRLGHFPFFVFYFVCGISASLLHAFFNLGSKIPAVGASGAIAGILGAYFLLFPRARILTIIPIFIFWQVVEIPAFFFLGFWFLYQFFLGVISIGKLGGGIAFWAHIGGFAAGIVFLKLFLKKRSY